MNNAKYGQKPHVEDMTEVDIPELDIPEQIVNNNGVETAVQARQRVSKICV